MQPDPSTPYTIFTDCQRRYIVFTAAGAALFSSVSPQIYYPVLNVLAEDFDVSVTAINLTVTSYMVLQAVAPVIFGPLSDRIGRRPVYIMCLVIYIAANIGLALQNHYVALLLLRCIQSAGSSSAVPLSFTAIADIYPRHQRGLYMGLVLTGTFAAPAFGPILGGILGQYLGWRAIFWFQAIVSGVLLLPLLFFLPETARNVVGNGSGQAQSWNKPFVAYLRTKSATLEYDNDGQQIPTHQSQSDHLVRRMLAPLLILRHKASFILFMITGAIFAGYSAIMASMTSVFHDIYRLNELQIGLCYIALGVGGIFATIASGKVMDAYYRYLTTTTSDGDEAAFPIEKARCVVVFPVLVLFCLTTIAFGWVLEFRLHLAAPVTLTFFMSFGATGAMTATATLLVDFHPTNPGAASSSSNFLRCMLGAGFTAAINPLLGAIGRGWVFSLIAFVVLGTVPLLGLLIYMGRNRQRSRSVV